MVTELLPLCADPADCTVECSSQTGGGQGHSNMWQTYSYRYGSILDVNSANPPYSEWYLKKHNCTVLIYTSFMYDFFFIKIFFLMTVPGTHHNAY